MLLSGYYAVHDLVTVSIVYKIPLISSNLLLSLRFSGCIIISASPFLLIFLLSYLVVTNLLSLFLPSSLVQSLRSSFIALHHWSYRPSSCQLVCF